MLRWSMSSWRDPRWTRLARAGAVVAGLIVGALVGARPASAHAILIGSDPANGATLAYAPAAVTLRFSDALTSSRSSATLVDASGHGVDGSAVAVAEDQPRTLTVSL